jgi:hypothetical protein
MDEFYDDHIIKNDDYDIIIINGQIDDVEHHRHTELFVSKMMIIIEEGIIIIIIIIPSSIMIIYLPQTC